MDKKTDGWFTLQWHITHPCNLRCTHCYQDDYSAFESRDSLSEILDQYGSLLNALNMHGYLNITGGEPLTHPDLFWLLSEARSRGMTAAVLTNGTLIGKREAARLKACGVDYVQVSLDGTEKVHDAIRGKGSFARAVEGIRLLCRNNIFVTVSFTAQRSNLNELPKLARFCRDIGVNKLWYDRVVIPSLEDKEQLSLSAVDFARLNKRAARLNSKGMVSCARALQFLPCREKHIYKCMAGKRLLTVLADGTVMACRRLPVVAGNVRESDLLSIYTESPEILSVRNAAVPSECTKCEYAQFCAGGAKCIAFARTGRYDLPDPDCPILTKKQDQIIL